MAVVEHRSDVRGVDLSWSEEGQGPVVLRGHGLTGSRAAESAGGLIDWSPVGRAGRRLVSYDARGHGHSGGGSDPAAYTWPELAADALGLADTVAPGQAIGGIGLSMGTATLLHAAVAEPGRFDRLVLSAPPTAWSTRRAQAEMYLAGAALVEERGLKALVEMLAQAPVPTPLRDQAARPAPDVAEERLPSVLRGAARSDLPPEEAIAALDLPVLILAWDDDPGHPVSTATRLQELLRGSRLEVAASGDDLRRWGQLAADFLAPAAP